MRDDRIDAVKGFAITAVVYGHVVRGMSAAGLITSGSAIAMSSERFAYFFHLPLFAFVTGLFMARSVEKRGAVAYLKQREWQFLWPYLVWTLIMGVFSVITSSVKNSPTSWGDVARIWEPLGHLWYLPFLMIATLVITVLRPWRRGAWGMVASGLIVALSLATWGVDGVNVFVNGMALLVFFAAGSIVGPKGLTGLWNALPKIVLVLLGLAAVSGGLALGLLTEAQLPTTASAGTTVAGVALGAVASVLATAGFMLLAGVVQGAFAGFWAFLGRQSMVIYLGHILATAGTRIVLMKLGVTDPWMHLLLGTLIGTAGPLLMLPVMKVFPWIVEAPALPSRTQPAIPPRGA